MGVQQHLLLRPCKAGHAAGKQKEETGEVTAPALRQPGYCKQPGHAAAFACVCNAELCSGVPEKAAGRLPGVGEAGSGRGPIQKEKTLGKEGSVKTGCAGSVGAQSPNTAPMQKLRPGREQRQVGPQSSARK